MIFDQRFLYETLVRFYSIIADEPDIHYSLRGKLGHLVRRARKAMQPNWSDEEKLRHLLQLFYVEWGFHCDENEYFYVRNLCLPYVLDTHSGTPVSLGAVLLYVAAGLGVPLYPVNFPTQLILRAEIGDEVRFIDPWDGSEISQEKLQQLYQGAFGFGATLRPDDLARASLNELESRFEQMAKNALIREEHNEMAFCYIQRLLRFQNPPDPYNIRDRGLVLAQMGAYPAALKDLEYFVEHCPQDPTAALIRTQLLELKGEIDNDLFPVH